MRGRITAVILGALLMQSAPGLTTETVTYTYDARGRLIKVTHTGTVNNNVQTDYTHDKASNRKKVKTTGAP